MFALEQAQEVLLKLGIGGGGGAVARNEHNVVPVGQWLTMRPQYLADAPAQQVAHYCVASRLVVMIPKRDPFTPAPSPG